MISTRSGRSRFKRFSVRKSHGSTSKPASDWSGLLRQFDEIGGKNLEVRYVDVEPFSQQAEEAEHFGIEPVQVMTEKDGRRSEVEVYLGAVVISSYDKVVVPFFGKGLPIEYELTRSVQTVADEKRHTRLAFSAPMPG